MKAKRLVLSIISLVVLVTVLAIIIYHLVRIANICTFLEQGKNALDQNNNDIALTKYTRALNLILWDKGKKADCFLGRGRAYFKGTSFDLSIVDFSKAIELRPDDYASYFWRGRACYEQYYFDLSITNFSKAIELRPDDHASYFWRGNAYYEIGNYDLAITDYNEAIRLNFDDSDISGMTYEYLGDIYSHKNEWELALLLCVIKY